MTKHPLNLKTNESLMNISFQPWLVYITMVILDQFCFHLNVSLSIWLQPWVKEMEALVCRKHGDPTNPPDSSENSPLSVSTSHPIPNLISPTSVRVRIKSISLNYATYLQVLGKYQEKFPLPFVLGSDYSGVVESVGPNVTKFKIGDRICAHAGVGSFARGAWIVSDRLFFCIQSLIKNFPNFEFH